MTSSTGAPTEWEVRVVQSEEIADVFRLRLGWAEERGGLAHDAERLIQDRVEWAVRHRDTHIPHVAVTHGRVVGMAWLALTARVPGVGGIERLCGDLQACYVLPEFRCQGIGGALVDAVHATAQALGAEHVTVHSSGRAIALYERHGFRHSSRLLWAGPGD